MSVDKAQAGAQAMKSTLQLLAQSLHPVQNLAVYLLSRLAAEAETGASL